MAKGKRREKGDGSLYPRKNRAGKVIGWFGAYTAEDGKRKRVYAKTREEAKALLTRAIADAEESVRPSARESDLEVTEYLAAWLSDCQASLKVTSYRRYEHSVQKHLTPAIGGVQLSKLSPAEIQSLYQAKLRDGLSPRSVIHLHEALRRACNRWLLLGGVVPRAAVYVVVATAALDNVVPAATADGVAAVVALKHVASGASVYRVVSVVGRPTNTKGAPAPPRRAEEPRPPFKLARPSAALTRLRYCCLVS